MATWLEQLGRDLRYAFRALLRYRGFTATAVLALALGIGANTAIFSIIDALLLRSLPVRAPHELLQPVLRAVPGARAGESFSYDIVGALAAEKAIFSGVTGFASTSFNVGDAGSLTRVDGANVTGGYHETLGLVPVAGRLLNAADDIVGAPPVAVLSYDYWERQFASNPAAIGRTLTVNGVAVTVIGVTPPGFAGTTVGVEADVTMAVAMVPQLDAAAAVLLGPGNFWMRVLARPADGVSVAEARARLQSAWPAIADRVISSSWTAERRRQMAEATWDLMPGATGYTPLRDLFRKPLLVLFSIVGAVLLIACANVANLLLARATVRQREIALRFAVGATRAHVVRQLLTESILLALLGAFFGIWLAWVCSGFLVDVFVDRTGRQLALDVAPSGRVLAFTIGVAFVTAIVFGLIPALRTAATPAARVMKNDTQSSRGGTALLSVLASIQVALSLLLLIGAGLFVETLMNLQRVDMGFEPDGVLSASVDARREGVSADALLPFYDALLTRLEQAPDVESVSLSSNVPLSGSSWSEAVAPRGQPLPERDSALFVAVTPRFFDTMRTPLLLGRPFDGNDRGAPNVAIVNEAFAKRHFPGGSPVGAYLTANVTRPASDLQIVGVARDSIGNDLRAAAVPTVYVAYAQRLFSGGFIFNTTLEVRTSGPRAAAAVRAELERSFPSALVPVMELGALVDQVLVEERLMASLGAGFGVLGLVLACVGIYGLLSYAMLRRLREIGIRVALGARSGAVLRLALASALRPLAIGFAVGVPAAWAAARWIESMLYGVAPADPATVVGAVLLLLAAGMAAAYLPARRAARVDPMVTLRLD